MVIRKWFLTLLCLPGIALAQQPEVYESVLNPVHNVNARYQVKAKDISVGLFNQTVGAYQRISVYTTFSDKSPVPPDELAIVMQTIDDHKVDRPSKMPLTLTFDGAKIRTPPLEKISTRQQTQRVTDITVKPAVEKDLPVTITFYFGVIPLSTLDQWAAAKEYDLEFDGIRLAPMWLPIASVKALQSAVKQETAMFASNQLIPFRGEGKYGFANTRGGLVIPAKYDFAGIFHEGMARVAVDDPQAASGEGGVKRRYGYIDMSGKEVIPLRYSGASPFRGGVAQVIPLEGGKPIMINKAGQMPTVGPTALGWKFAVYNGSEGWGTWETEDRIMISIQPPKGPWQHGFWDMQGKIIVPAKYEQANFYSHGKASLRDGKDWFIADKTGNIQKMGRPSGVTVVDGYSDNGMALVKKDNACKDPAKAWSNTSANILERLCIDGYGFADSTGRTAVPPIYVKGNNFSEGIAAVGKPVNCQKDTCRVRFTYIDETGKELMPASFQRADPFSEGLAAVIVAPDAKSANSPSAGLAAIFGATDEDDLDASSVNFAKTGGRVYIDRNGPGPTTLYPETVATTCAGKTSCDITLGAFQDNTAPITVKHSAGKFTYFIDRAGRIYWDGK